MIVTYDFFNQIKSYDKIIFDTCAVLSDGFIPLLYNEFSSLKAHNQKITIHVSVLKEMLKLYSSGKKDDRISIKMLQLLRENDLLDFIGDTNDPQFVDKLLLEYVVLNKTNKKLQ